MAAFNLKAVLETEVIDKLITVMALEDKKLSAQIAKMGTRVGSAATFAALPTVDQNGKAIGAGDTATLTTTDGANPAGLYEFDGTDYVLAIDYDALDVASIITKAKSVDGSIVVDPATGAVIATEDAEFTTPKQVGTALVAFKLALDALYHPKGGEDTIGVVGKDAEEKTQGFVTANQLDAKFTLVEVQAKYDAV